MISRDTEISLFTVSLHSLPSVVPSQVLNFDTNIFFISKIIIFLTVLLRLGDTQSCQRTWILWEGDRGESYGAVWFGSHSTSSCKSFVMFAYIVAAWKVNDRHSAKVIRFPPIDFCFQIWSRSFTIVICLLTEPVLIFFF